MTKKLLLVCAFALLAAACQKKTAQDNLSQPTPTPVQASKKTVSAEWTLKDLGFGKYDEPFTQVGLKLTGEVNKEIDLGKFNNCKTETPEAGQILALTCWWAGAGDDLYVSVDDKKHQLVVTHQPTGEQPEGAPPLKADILKSINLPEGVEVWAK